MRDNIAAFGGDPDRVTIFGESAGGMSVGTLLGTSSAAGLFRGAVAQSGAAHNLHTRHAASRIAEIVLDSLGVAPGDAGRLREVTTEQLLQAHDKVALQHMGRPGAVLLPFQPVVDGEVLPKLPIEAVAEGLSAEVAVLVGSTRDEWNLFGIMDPRQSSLDEAAVTARLEAAVGGEAKRLLQVYRSARAAAADPSPRDLYFAIETDRIFRMPAVRLAEAGSRHQPRTYQYLFTWESPAGDLGACHGIDLPFVFGLVEGEGAALFSGSSPEAHALAEQTMDAWLAFARSGDPSHEGLGDWPPFDTERRATMLLGATCDVADAPFDTERRAWEGVL